MLSSSTATRLEKAAVDSGFDQELPRAGDWLTYSSTHAPLKVWLTVDGEIRPIVALSRLDVADALTDHGTRVISALPHGASAARGVPDVPELHRLLRRAYQLARTLPDELLNAFEQVTATMARATEAERLTVQRVGQDLFRSGLMEYWEGRCAITGLGIPQLLRASHIKPWADCENDTERLDVFNGFLLAPSLDAAFDQGFIAVEDDGRVLLANALQLADLSVLGLDRPIRIARLVARHRAYLPWHRQNVFKKGPAT